MPLPKPNYAQENMNQGKPMQGGPVANWLPDLNGGQALDPGFYQGGATPLVPIYVTQPAPVAQPTVTPSWYEEHKTEILVGGGIVAVLVLADILIGGK